ncbi:MAG: hypothetical protein WC511_04750 [Candidatus Pacearchaeota archaeon]
MNDLEKSALEKIRESLIKGDPLFPNACCFIAADAVKNNLGYNIVRGSFVLKGYKNLHYWNETPDGKIVDLTASQFSQRFPEILITDKNSDCAKTYYYSYIRDMSL